MITTQKKFDKIIKNLETKLENIWTHKNALFKYIKCQTDKEIRNDAKLYMDTLKQEKLKPSFFGLIYKGTEIKKIYKFVARQHEQY